MKRKLMIGLLISAAIVLALGGWTVDAGRKLLAPMTGLRSPGS
jgi:hypothetical protein